MYSPPFHRRILPWIFAAIFLGAAPVVVFYTAGYRWNPKKEKVERNGTLILNSRPTSARILLNGTDTDETTPATIQNVQPGRTLIRFEKDGYHPWQKQLEVLPQYVTFANEVVLWKIADAHPIAQFGAAFDAIKRLEVSPNERTVAALAGSGASSSLILWSLGNDTLQTFEFEASVTGKVSMIWSDDSRSLLLEAVTASGTASWLMNVRNGRSLVALPTGTYRWNGTRLEGTADGNVLEILDDGSISRAPLRTRTVDALSGFTLQHATGTDNLVLFGENERRGLILPAGNWRIVDVVREHVILRDGDSWLSLDPSESEPQVVRAYGDALRPFTERRRTTFLLVNQGEIWSWNPANEPELLLRESGRIAEAVWHSSGRNVFIASNGGVSVLNLDQRDGRLRTALASFDEVSDVAALDERLYIAGRKGEQTGIWELEIE